jgi:hypothetical protein
MELAPLVTPHLNLNAVKKRKPQAAQLTYGLLGSYSIIDTHCRLLPCIDVTPCKHDVAFYKSKLEEFIWWK